jgi:hypothetical protein
MLRVILIIYGLVATSFCAMAQEESIAKLLDKDQVEKSPNGNASCLVNFLDKNWYEVQIRFSADRTETVWKSTRPPGVSWSPNGEYFVVEDYLDRLASAVLVFKVDYKNQSANLIYQTPYSNSVFDHYYAAGWAKGGVALQIKRVDHDTRAVKCEETVELGNKQKITQTIYPPRP